MTTFLLPPPPSIPRSADKELAEYLRQDIIWKQQALGRLGIVGQSLTSLTATADELNVLDGVTATTAEINVLDGSVAGTAVASKAAVLGVSKDLDTLVLGSITVDSEAINPVIYLEITANQSALASGAEVVVKSSAGSSQYKVRDIILSADATNFSGGGGDRDISIESDDGTVTYSTVSAATLAAISAARWGSTALPFPSTAADLLTATPAGDDLVIRYTGGTTDYTAGQLKLLITLEKTA